MSISLGAMWINPSSGVNPSQCIAGGFGADANGNIEFAMETGDGGTKISGTLYAPQASLSLSSASYSAGYSVDIQSQQGDDPSVVNKLLESLDVAIQHYAAQPGGEYSSSAPQNLNWADRLLKLMENSNIASVATQTGVNISV